MAKKADENKAGLKKIYRKSWPWDNLYGSSRFELNSADRGIWNDLLDLAKLGRVRPGLIAPAKGQAYSHAWLVGLLNVGSAEFEHAIKILADTGRIRENGSGIEIINWGRYQTDSDRVKAWREAKKEQEKDPDKYIKGYGGHLVKR